MMCLSFQSFQNHSILALRTKGFLGKKKSLAGGILLSFPYFVCHFCDNFVSNKKLLYWPDGL